MCATWCEDSSVRLWDLSHQLGNLHAPGKGGGGASARGEPLKTFGGHGDEGYAAKRVGGCVRWEARLPRAAGRE